MEDLSRKKSRLEVMASHTITDLPDSVFVDILSLLPVKKAVATCLLSKGWSHIRLSLPSLDFDESNFSSVHCFLQYVDAVLRIRDDSETLKKFHLILRSKYSSEQLKKINTQINTALDSKPEHVELYDHKAWNNEIPSSIFKCNTITVLKLRGVEVVATATNPSFVDLPSLKVLYLSNVTFLNREFVYNLLYSCPSLQDLSLKYCYTHHADGRWRTVPINYASLRELMPAYSSQYPFTLGERLKNLVSADVYKYPFTLQSLSNARTLRIDTIGYSTRYVFPIFYNIIHLELRYYSDISYGAIFQCLQNCPKLQTLKINKFDLRGRGRLEGDIPQCLSSHLKEFHLGNYRGLENEFKLARFIMNHARFLDIISIRTLAANSEEKEIMLQRLSSCFIRSANCKLLLE
ncbi:hypothetical protein K1719_045060 [Acacia pycnantha]|nr:hypothetical protein K1719_045060 [Acacia pycnantha]